MTIVPFLTRPAIAALAVLALTGIGAARDLTGAENAALTETVEAFADAIDTNDWVHMVDAVPPAIYEEIARQVGGIPVDELKKAVVQQSEATAGDVTFTSFDMDLDAARTEELPDGTPYVVIPTESVMEVSGSTIRATTSTLALLDEAKWYLVRIDDAQQVDVLKTVYPGFADVEFEPGTMEVVE